MLRALMIAALLGPMHPIHSSTAELRLPAGAGPAEIVLRVFVEDFPPGQAAAAAGRYLAERFHLLDGRGTPVPLRLSGMTLDGAVLVLTLSTDSKQAWTGGRVWHGVLAERFSDQVNLVRIHRNGRSTTIVFSAGDGPKPLP
jgi:hypothetical protein